MSALINNLAFTGVDLADIEDDDAELPAFVVSKALAALALMGINAVAPSGDDGAHALARVLKDLKNLTLSAAEVDRVVACDATHAAAAKDAEEAKARAADDPADLADDVFHCSACGHPNYTRRVHGDSWYCVTRGKAIGVFPSWEITSPLVTGVPNNCHKKYKSKDDAQTAFDEAAAKGLTSVYVAS